MRASRLCPLANNDPNHYKYTGKERDSETGLDYFGARYYGNVFGRFTSADEPFVHQDTSDPQSWNPYGYARNNPIRYVDADGRQVRVCLNTAGGGQQCETVDDRTYVDALEGERHQNILTYFDISTSP